MANLRASAAESCPVRIDQRHIYNKMKMMERILSKNPKAADLKLLLYMSAYDRPRDTGCLRPFPPGFNEENDERLLSANEEIPTTELLHFYLQRPYRCNLPRDTMEVIFWNLVCLKEPRLVPIGDVRGVLTKVENKGDTPVPSLVFKLMYSTTATVEMTWQATVERCPATKFAYFSTQTYNYHSLLYEGMEAAVRSQTERGSGEKQPGIVLTEDLRSCLDSVDPTWVWGKSSIGQRLSVVTLVEYSDDPEAKPVPLDDGSFLVEDAGRVRLRYLLVYVQKEARAVVSPKSWSPVVVRHGVARALISLTLLVAITAVRTNPASVNHLLHTVSTLACDARKMFLNRQSVFSG